MAASFSKRVRASMTSFPANRLRRKMRVRSISTLAEFFSLMKSRLKEGGIATFWLPLDQLKVNEAKAILRAFHDVFSNASVWASADENWIMMGINGPGRKIKEEEIRRLWSDPASGADLRRHWSRGPQQFGALFLMDGEEIDRITQDVAPLTDIYPKRLRDAPWDDEASHRFALTYLDAPSAFQRFLWSPLINRIWPEALNPETAGLESFFNLRQSRYLSEMTGSNQLAELDLYLRRSRLRIPVLEVLGSDGFRLSIAERVAKNRNRLRWKPCQTWLREHLRNETSTGQFVSWRTRKIVARLVSATHFCLPTSTV